ncbi:MAG: SdpI family protein [Flavipsychrobacter sp.]|nr:SdpI family protein [Flavipsychrobacter sp.]
MIKNSLLRNLLFTFISFIPAIYLLITWSNIPAIVPTHFGLNGPDQYAPKETLRTIVIVLSAITASVYLLMQYLYKIDPKRLNKPQAPVFNKMGAGLVLFLSAINIVLVYTALHIGAGSEKITMVLSGLLFAFLGNIMYSLKPNYFAGIKIPWTLSSDYNWRKTHQLAGVLWFTGGILLTIASLIYSYEIVSRITLCMTLIFVIVPIGYSYFLFRKEQNNPQINNVKNEQ